MPTYLPTGFWAGTSACSSNAVAGSDNDTRQAGIQQTDPPPDHGQLRRSLRCGAAAVGASQWVTNLNVPLATDDLKAARLIARSVGHRGGGLPFVEAMALPHANGAPLPLPPPPPPTQDHCFSGSFCVSLCIQRALCASVL